MTKLYCVEREVCPLSFGRCHGKQRFFKPVFLLLVTAVLFPMLACWAVKPEPDDFEPEILQISSASVGLDIDGKISDDEWKGARRIDLKLTGKDGVQTDKSMSADATSVFLLRDRDKLFVGARCLRKNMDDMLPKHTVNQFGIFEDESMVVYFAVEDNYYRLVQFMVNAIGSYYVDDNYQKIPSTSGLTVKTSRYDNRWEMEMVIPIREVLVKPDQEAFKFNVTRTICGRDGEIKAQSGWTVVQRNDWYPLFPSADSVRHFNVLFMTGKDTKHDKAVMEMLKTNKVLPVEPVEKMSGEELGRAKWFKHVKPVLRFNPSLVYVEDVPDLPRVLIIGDSVSMGYTPVVRELLAGKANVHRIPGNGGPTERGLGALQRWLRGEKWDVICFNWGLHDAKYTGWDVKTGKKYSTPEKYGKNLETLVGMLEATGAKLLWFSTTPVPDGAKGNVKGDELGFNKAAEKIMRKHRIPVEDLHAGVLPFCDKYQTPCNIHFNHDGYLFLGKKVADGIMRNLNK